MPALTIELRRRLEKVITEARERAEEAARAALRRLAMEAAKPFDDMFTGRERDLRNRLRARGRQAGDRRRPDGVQDIEQLTQELAYEYWHRMLFARFLAENHLLMHPDGVAVSLAECEELALARSRRPERLRPGGPLRQHDAAANLPHRRRAAGDRVPGQRPAAPGEAARQPARRHVHRRRQPRMGLPVLAGQEEGRGQQERREDRRAHACPP